MIRERLGTWRSPRPRNTHWRQLIEPRIPPVTGGPVATSLYARACMAPCLAGCAWGFPPLPSGVLQSQQGETSGEQCGEIICPRQGKGNTLVKREWYLKGIYYFMPKMYSCERVLCRVLTWPPKWRHPYGWYAQLADWQEFHRCLSCTLEKQVPNQCTPFFAPLNKTVGNVMIKYSWTNLNVSSVVLRVFPTHWSENIHCKPSPYDDILYRLTGGT